MERGNSSGPNQGIRLNVDVSVLNRDARQLATCESQYQSPISTSHYGSLKQAQLLLSAMSDNFAHQRQFPLIDDLIGAAVLPLSAQRND